MPSSAGIPSLWHVKVRVPFRHTCYRADSYANLPGSTSRTATERQLENIAFHSENGADNLAAIRHPSFSAVFVSTPEHDHREAVVQALEAGKPVFVEKPLSFSLADGDAIVEAARRTGTEIRVGYSRRHERRWMLAREKREESTPQGDRP